MLDSIYHLTVKVLKIAFFGVKTSVFSHILSNVMIDVIKLRNLSTTIRVTNVFPCINICRVPRKLFKHSPGDLASVMQ